LDKVKTGSDLTQEFIYKVSKKKYHSLGNLKVHGKGRKRNGTQGSVSNVP